MVSLEDLKQIVILSYLTDEMIESILPFVLKTGFEEKEIIFKEGEPADTFYMLKRGKILLELRIADKMTISVGSVNPGYSFGWSAMLDDGLFTTDALSAEPCEVFAINAEKLKEILSSDFEMGYRLSQRLLVVIKKRLDVRTEQLIRVIKNHPDMKHLF